MKAIVYRGAGDASVIAADEVESPTLKSRQIRISVRASGLNRADLGQRKGVYPPPPGEGDIPGLEAAGVVVEAGADARRFKTGDRVMALLGGVGTSAIQLVRETGARAFATAGSAEKTALCEKLGAVAIDYKREDFGAIVLEKTNGRGVDAILDPVGASNLDADLRCLAVGGTLVLIGTMGGKIVLSWS